MSKEHITKSGVIRNTLTGRDRFRLTQLILEDYKKSVLLDEDFAKQATAKMGFTVTAIHVANIRREFDIPANLSRGGAATSATNVFRDEIRKRLDQLEEQMATLLRERKERAHGPGNHHG